MSSRNSTTQDICRETPLWKLKGWPNLGRTTSYYCNVNYRYSLRNLVVLKPLVFNRYVILLSVQTELSEESEESEEPLVHYKRKYKFHA